MERDVEIMGLLKAMTEQLILMDRRISGVEDLLSNIGFQLTDIERDVASNKQVADKFQALSEMVRGFHAQESEVSCLPEAEVGRICY